MSTMIRGQICEGYRADPRVSEVIHVLQSDPGADLPYFM